MSRKRKAIKGNFKKQILALHGGSSCVNCNSTEGIEWHHIVPVCYGGNDVPRNIVPLCKACHDAVTHCELLMLTSIKSYNHNGGRKREIPENYRDILDDYLHCRISKSEAAKLLGWEGKSNFADSPWFKEYKKEQGIANYRNNIDIRKAQERRIKANHQISWHSSDDPLDGRYVGYVKYKDGKIENFLWDSENNTSKVVLTI